MCTSTVDFSAVVIGIVIHKLDYKRNKTEVTRIDRHTFFGVNNIYDTLLLNGQAKARESWCAE